MMDFIIVFNAIAMTVLVFIAIYQSWQEEYAKAAFFMAWATFLAVGLPG